ncbi:manganese-dependent inorganic pyrophosphatase [Peptoclostridium litorale DSM 5388]|uniref:inorganic diphosphatase n=1 Tax=Peptoclostridium litorale DSM 5388 TaxID=1121324 RepID=A0A069RLB7_PEPLI|nr:putative manganese-dependent inorganic diphosphatase [Peptoclostridium litorale]KDR94997.1 cobalt-dependent inorganic pyrophosphatase [Peptoclostridium litorale DSM 5388]SIN76828.1 manganese-dependent inorganic pyrophosphatase [Peptoclostridium litorale DSM 5388]
MSILVFGHKNPDTDSVASAIGLSRLKNKQGVKSMPCVLDEIGRESQYVLDRFGVERPDIIDNVKIQIKDLEYEKTQAIRSNSSIRHAYRIMESQNIKILPIVGEESKLEGIVTMKDIAMAFIRGNHYHIETNMDNLINDLDAKVLTDRDEGEITGDAVIGAFYHETLKKVNLLGENSIVIVGDRYDIIDIAIQSGVRLIVVTGGNEIPSEYLRAANEKGISMIATPYDTYTTSRLISQCNYISIIMKSKGIVSFNEEEYLDDFKEEIKNKRHSNYPIVSGVGAYLGFVNRRHILTPGRKKVILVDHNEYGQSAKGLEEAQIMEIVDHHKIGDISTSMPISFRNIPVGSTCTIVYGMYEEAGVEIDRQTAGILLSGILSDTLIFKSPTSTHADKRAAKKLNEILDIDIEEFAMDMFKAGTSIEGKSIEDIFYGDFKEFAIEGHKVGISQVFTLDIDQISSKRGKFLEYMEGVHKEEGSSLTMMLVTDIIKNGSYVIFVEDVPILKHVLGDIEQGDFMKGVVSRKKQVIPMISRGIGMLG